MAGSHQVIFEFIRIGSSVKVTAIDPVTGVEASIVGTPSAGEVTLKNLAMKKLIYVLNKKNTPPNQ